MARFYKTMPLIILVLIIGLSVGLGGCASQTAQTPPDNPQLAAEPMITNVEAKKEGEKVKVVITTTQPIRYKTIFKANNPLRVVVDLQGYKFFGVPANKPINMGVVESINVESTSEGTRKMARININLSQMVPFESTNGGDALYIEFDSPTAAAAAPSEPAKEAAAPAATKEAASSAPETVKEKYKSIAESSGSEATEGKPAAETKPAETAPAPATPAPAAPSVTITETTPAPPKGKEEPQKPVPAGGPVVVSGFEIKNNAAGATVTISADGPMGGYESFQLSKPSRLVLDIPNATHAAPKQVTAKDAGIVVKLRSSQYKDAPKKIVRVVLDLAKNVDFNIPYKVDTTDNQLVVLLGEAVAAAKPAPAPEGAPAEAAAKPGVVRNIVKIDFKMVDKKSQIMVIAADGGELKYNINRLQDPPSIVLDVLDTKLAPSVRKTLDLRGLPSSVAQVRVLQHQKEPQSIVRLIMDLKGLADFQVLPAAKGLVVEVAAIEPGKAPAAGPPQAVAPPVPSAPSAPAAPGEPPLVSMDFKEADIGNILRLLSEVGKVNIVMGEDVKAKVTVRLENLQWERALDVILKANNLAYTKEDSVIRVARAETLKREDEEKLRARDNRDKTIPLVIRAHVLNYARATDMAKSLTKVLTSRGAMQVDERTNTLIISDVPEKVEEIIKLAVKLDTRTPQVMIEARIVEVTSPDFEREIGIQWGFQFKDRYSRAKDTAPMRDFPRGVTATGDSGTTPFLINVPVSQALGAATPAGAAAITLGRALGMDMAQLDLRIQAHENIGDLKVISSPKVSVLDNVEAEVQSGASIPIQVVEQGEVSTKYIDANIDLKVTPRITKDNSIRLKVAAKKNEPDFGRTVNGNPIINKREATTEVLVQDGETIVIGGVFKGTENHAETRVPWLGQIPIVGWLFKRQYDKQTNEELLIFITPQILKGV
jgi:type IV pilus assembly protein PilQ